MTPGQEKEFQARLNETVKKIAEQPANYWWSNTVRQVEHIHLMDGEYDGCIVYLFPRWYCYIDSCKISFNTRTGCIDGTMGDLTAREICDYGEEISNYWEEYFNNCK